MNLVAIVYGVSIVAIKSCFFRQPGSLPPRTRPASPPRPGRRTGTRLSRGGWCRCAAARQPPGSQRCPACSKCGENNLAILLQMCVHHFVPVVSADDGNDQVILLKNHFIRNASMKRFNDTSTYLCFCSWRYKEYHEKANSNCHRGNHFQAFSTCRSLPSSK